MEGVQPEEPGRGEGSDDLARGWDLNTGPESRAGGEVGGDGGWVLGGFFDEPAGEPDFSLHLVDSEVGPAGAPRAHEAGPAAGEIIAGFRLVRLLGKGTFAWVYLAEQIALANRLVALKVSRQSVGDESKMLARLQHSHIVPVFSAHEDQATGYSVFCMPYLGGDNLAKVLEEARGRADGRAWTGADLVEALDRLGEMDAEAPGRGSAAAQEAVSGKPSEPASGPRSRSRSGRGRSAAAGRPGASAILSGSSRSLFDGFLAQVSSWGGEASGSAGLGRPDEEEHEPYRRFLRGSGGVSASVWIVARLAEGLAHAHSRGLLHRDLKPSNILLTADGSPMILDFNLSAGSDMREGGGAKGALRENVGGTLPYMAPEHLDAFNPAGQTEPEAVDERSDVYSLGLILFEMLTGRPAFPDPPANLTIMEQLEQLYRERREGRPSAREANPELPWSLDAVLAKCLDPRPGGRYASAGQLAEDLQRHLDDQPLRHTWEPSPRERLAKFRRRNPRVIASTNVGLVAGLALMVLVAVLVLLGRGLTEARGSLRFRDFEETFARSQFLLNTSAGPRDRSDEGVRLALSALRRYDLDPPAPGWDRRREVAILGEGELERLRSMASELQLLLARASVRAAEGRGGPARVAALQGAIRRLDQAEALDPHPPAVLYQDRSRYYDELGLGENARADAARAREHAPRSARDFYLLGSALLARRDPDAAEPLLVRAVSLDSKLVWAWFALGFCRADQERWLEAAENFGVCTALADGFAWAYYNRGAAFQRAGRLVDARLCFDRALELEPGLIEARYNRGLAALGMGRLGEAEADFEAVMRGGWDGPVIRAGLAEAYARQGREAEAEEEFAIALRELPGDAAIVAARGVARIGSRPAEARRDLEEALAIDPAHVPALMGLARLTRPVDPRGALGLLDRAVAERPGLMEAVEARAVVRGQLGMASALEDVARLKERPTPRGLYNAACALCRLSGTAGDPALLDEAMRLLRRSLRAGQSVRVAREDETLAPLRGREDFRALMREMGEAENKIK